MKKLALAAAGLSLGSALLSTSAFATSPGAFAGGNNLYKVYNVTTNNDYASSTNAACDQTVKVSIELSNTDYGTIKNITVKAPLNGSIVVSGTDSEGQATTSTGKATVTVDKGTLAYNAGSTVVRSLDGKTSTPQADGITTSGVNVGNLAGSTREFVQFTATVKCPTTPVTPTTPTTPVTPETPKAPETPVTELPSTGAGNMTLAAIVVAGISAAAVYAVRAGRSLRQN